MLTKLGKAILPSAIGTGYFIVQMAGDGLKKVIAVGKTLRTDLSSYNGIGGIKYMNPALMSNPQNRFNSAMNSGGHVLFGSGTTSPTENDTDIESLITGITASVSNTTSPAIGFSDGKVYRYLDYTITNNNSSEITVSEVAIYASVLVGQNIGDTLETGLAKMGVILFSRSVLTNPVRIAAGEAGIVRVKFEYN